MPTRRRGPRLPAGPPIEQAEAGPAAVLRRWKLSVHHGIGRDLLDTWRNAPAGRRAEARAILDAAEWCEAAAAKLRAAMEGGDRWETGNTILRLRVELREWAAEIDPPGAAPPPIGAAIDPSDGAGEPPPEPRRRFAAWSLDRADAALREAEALNAAGAASDPRHGPPCARPTADNAWIKALVDAAAQMHAFAYSRDPRGPGRGKALNDRRLIFALDRFMLASDGTRLDRANVAEIAAALLSAAAGKNAPRWRPLVDRMRKAHERLSRELGAVDWQAAAERTKQETDRLRKRRIDGTK